jgi:3-methyladenine DNA glycosylase AlkD
MGQGSFAQYISILQSSLQAKAVPKTKAWWGAYMKQVIPFRGVKMPAIRAVLHQWYTTGGIDHRLSFAEQKDLALDLFAENYAEDKLAGILFLQEILLPAGAVDCPADVSRLAALFTENRIYDWNTCDWFCVKVLGPLIRREGDGCAAAIAGWHPAENLWQARASVVPFVAVAANRAYYPLIQESCRTLIRREERFAKTAVGWILRDISKHDENWVRAFIENNVSYFSGESLKNATKYFYQRDRSAYLQRLKSAAQPD